MVYLKATRRQHTLAQWGKIKQCKWNAEDHQNGMKVGKKSVNLDFFETQEMKKSMAAEDEVSALMEKLENGLALLARL